MPEPTLADLRVLIRSGEPALLPVPWQAPELIEVPEPSRIAFAGCWHARAEFVRDAMTAARDGGATVLVHTGDFLYTYPAANKMLVEVETVAAELGMFVVVVRGNHDDPALFQKAVTSTRRRNKGPAHGGVADGFARLSPHVLHAPNGLRWAWQGVQFVALGGAFSVDRAARTEGVTYWAGEVASPRDIGAVKRDGKANVMITHDIPAGTHLPFGSTRPDWWDIENAEKHREGLRAAVDVVRPDWVVGGHMHIRFTDGLWLNDGHQVRVEVLDKIESGVENNLLIVDLSDGDMVPVGE